MFFFVTLNNTARDRVGEVHSQLFKFCLTIVFLKLIVILEVISLIRTIYHFSEFIDGLETCVWILPAVLACVLHNLRRWLTQFQVNAVIW